MIKTQITKKAILNSYADVISVGYCNAQHLLRYKTPIYYTYSRTYGWRADVYDVNGVAIVTGYAPFGTVRPSYDTVRAWDKKAEAVFNTVRHDDDRRDIINGYLQEFIKEVVNQ